MNAHQLNPIIELTDTAQTLDNAAACLDFIGVDAIWTNPEGLNLSGAHGNTGLGLLLRCIAASVEHVRDEIAPGSFKRRGGVELDDGEPPAENSPGTTCADTVSEPVQHENAILRDLLQSVDWMQQLIRTQLELNGKG